MSESLEALYSPDLATGRYSGKWRRAKEYVLSTNGGPGEDPESQLAYWLAVRKHYLELGGLYKEQLTP